MAKASSIFHSVNGYSRYDVPESKAFSCTPGPLYPVRIQYVNARDRIRIAQGIDVRSNPLAVPTFNPYVIRLHRFWVPLQLYHPEMRTNSSKFDMNNLTLNWIPYVSNPSTGGSVSSVFEHRALGFSNSLLFWLRIAHCEAAAFDDFEAFNPVATELPATAPHAAYANADTYLAYWDIVRNYYGYSQWGIYSFAWPASWYVPFVPTDSGLSVDFQAGPVDSFFTQRYGNLEFLDSYFESQFYPSAVPSENGTYNRFNLFGQIISSDLHGAGANKDGYPVWSALNPKFNNTPIGQTDVTLTPINTTGGLFQPLLTDVFGFAHPLAVVPSNPDRFSRLIPVGSDSAVSMTGVTTIPQLAIASRLQEYKDLLGAGGSRYSDWLETFFASKIEHVDRPKLLFSASQTVNVQVVMNQAGANNFQDGQQPLGQMGGAIAFNTQLGRSQSYYFSEPGYMIDMLSIRPVYYWASVRPDYLDYQGSDYFNPIYNDIGYQDVPNFRFGLISSDNSAKTLAQEPCFNEFRSSYDEVLGQLSVASGTVSMKPLYSYWVQQRAVNYHTGQIDYYPSLFVDMSQVNSPFQSNVEDNFFVNLSYAVRQKNLVNKSFATRLSNR